MGVPIAGAAKSKSSTDVPVKDKSVPLTKLTTFDIEFASFVEFAVW
ncbi:MAG: hypothetical protein QM751_15480 [Paludibacteraceae bacterium]